MDFGWILLGIAAWAILMFLALVLMQVSRDQEERAYRSERDMTPKPKAPGAATGAQEQAGERP